MTQNPRQAKYYNTTTCAYLIIIVKDCKLIEIDNQELVLKYQPSVQIIINREFHKEVHEQRKTLSPSQGLNVGLPNTSQMLSPLSHQDS